MKLVVAMLMIGSLMLLWSGEAASEIHLVEKGQGIARIVISESASDLERFAADELQRYIELITSAKLPILSDGNALQAGDILLGGHRHLAAIGMSIDIDRLGKEGFSIQTKDDHLIIAGRDRGLLYGVYTFLEDHLGCRWYSSTVHRIPKRESIALSAINDTQAPVLDYREVYYAGAMHPEFAAHLKLNGNAGSTGESGKIAKEVHAGWGYWCHSLYTLAPPEKYFAEHPEYFSLVGGKRKKDEAQLCLTNPDVLKISIQTLKEAVATDGQKSEVPIWADKGCRYWSVSQNDGGGNCECPACAEADRREGSPMGSLLPFVNAVAAQFPDRMIGTLAYTYSRRAPKNVRPADNVVIQLCSIETGRAAANELVSTSPTHSAFRRDLEEWAQIGNQLFIWDYVIQFQNLLAPFPNLRALQPNIQYFVNHKVKGIFEQGNREKGGEFCELRTYLLAKLLWNPNCDVNAIMNDFLKGYYGDAGSILRQYIDLLHDNLEKSGKAISIDGDPRDHKKGYLSEDALAQYKQLFDRAEKRVNDSPELLYRVRVARLPIMFAQLQLGYGSLTERQETARTFFSLAAQEKIWMLSEVDFRKDQVGNREMYKQYVEKMLDFSL